jgi:hypothetical protein
MEKTFDEWLQEGISSGFVGPAICYTHDGLPLSQQEDEEFEEGDPCIHILRLYEDRETKSAVEKNHSPSTWRASNAGFDLDVRKD